MTELHGFELIETRTLPELNTTARRFRHTATGAELLSLENDDENKVFGINFRTPPADSTGIAHILEHSVLCGSRKYPLKEPFVELLKGSLQTFLNAMTYPDKTCYPVASTNVQDFYNLVDVYLDAVLHPLITPEILQQEGWHYELTTVDEPLRYKGVVFNEMKGANSSPERVLYRTAQSSLYPGHTYGVDSGGDPLHIPDLTYEQFKLFHETFYHPSNAFIYVYGDDPPEERLRLLDSVLSEFSRREVDSAIPLQPRFDEPRRVVQSYAASAQDTAKGYVTLNWMFDEVADAELSLGLSVLEHVLIGTTAAPLRKALIDSGLGENMAGGGLQELRQMWFSVGLKGADPTKADAIEQLILETLATLVRDGIDPATTEASFNTIEFALRENNTGSYPRGLSLMLRALNTWLYAGDPFAQLAFEAPLAAIRQRLNQGEHYFEGLIERFLLHNQHRTTVVLQPDAELGTRVKAAEETRLAGIRAQMTPDDIAAVIANTARLKELQEAPDSPEALAALPSLTRNDLPLRNKITPTEEQERNGARIIYHDIFTNGIVYIDIGLNLHTLQQQFLPYVTLFGRALLETGTTSASAVQLQQRIGRETGGLHPQVFTTAVRGSGIGRSRLFLRGKATLTQAEELLAIMRDVLRSARFDNQERIRQIVLEEKASREAALVPSGHIVVNNRLRAQFNEADWATEQIGGVSYLLFLRRLAEVIDQDWPTVQGVLEQIRTTLVNRNALVVNVTVNADGWAGFAPQLDAFLEQVPAGTVLPVEWATRANPNYEGLIIPAQVNYVGKAADLYKLGYQLHGSALVATRYLRTSWLWEQIRVRGGAYGGFCIFDPRSGVFSYLSYRDPNLLATLDVYDRTGRFLRDLDLSEQELTRSIIGAISDLDSYQLPDARGYSAMLRHLAGDDEDYRQQLREEVLGTTIADFKSFADTLDQINAHGLVAVLGGEQALEAANTERPDLLELIRVL
ncbi:MAG: insulinase family protein [Roseiflexaceae bacterium]|nr:insulinase family protein [Roseiflexaceae bacterium]